MKIALVSLPVNSPIEAHKFYTGVLGFVTRTFMPEANLAIVASPEEPDGTGLLLEPNDNPIAKQFQSGVCDAGMPIIVFGVHDINREYERLSGMGVAFTQTPTETDYGTLAVFDDTCGNLIQLHQV
ncbi:MAG TPA: VOC family protein [Anaerolineae bacterium]|nr:VOC family protein [Anaerolineae bacterium]